MKLVYLPSTVEDLSWVRRYYTSVFPEGSKRARNEIKRAESLLLEYPLVGETVENEVREFHIRRTPFTILYRVTIDRVEILRIWDVRRGSHGNKSTEG